MKLHLDLDMATFSNQLSMLPTFIANKSVLLTTKVIENAIPLLLSKDAMKKGKTYIDFSQDEIIILMKKHLQSLAHQDIIVLQLKRNIALKLHHQFSHPNAQKHILLLKDANVDDNELITIINDVSDNWNML